jgi:hypothetical protein
MPGHDALPPPDDPRQVAPGDPAAVPRRPPSTLVCNVSALDGAYLAAIDAIARLALGARRAGREVRLEEASDELRGLLDLCGLAEVVPCEPGSAGETGG